MALDKSKEGQRVRLVHTSDEYTNLKPGDEGTIQFIDDMGTLAVAWDNGSRLGLLFGVDRWDIL